MMRRLRYGLMVLLAVLVLLYVFVLHTTWGLALALRIAAVYLPGELSVAEANGSLSGPLALTQVRYQYAGMSVSLESVELDWHSSALLGGRLAITSLRVRKVDVQLPDAGQASGAAGDTLLLPIALEVAQAEVDGVTIRQQGADAPIRIDAIHLSARSEAQVLHVKELQVRAYRTQLHSSGEVTLAPGLPLNLQTEFSYTLPDTQPLHGKGTLQGDLQHMKVQQDLSGLLTAALVGELHTLATEPQWQARVDIQKFNPADLTNALPNLTLPDVDIQGTLQPAGDAQRFRVRGDVQLDTPQMGLAELTLALQGDYRLSDYQFDVQGDFTGIDLPAANVDLAGTGTRETLTIGKLQLQTLQGEIQGEADMRWQPQLAVKAVLDMRNIETAGLARDWPGQLNARLSIQTTVQDGAPRINYVIRDLQGTVRDYPLAGTARGAWYAGRLQIDELQVSISESRLHAHGSLAENWDVTFGVSAPDLNHLLPDAHGKLTLDGRLRGSRSAPSLQLQGTATQLQYAQYMVEQISLTADLGLSAQDPLKLELQAQAMQTPAGQWQTASLTANGTAAAHEVTLAARNPQTSLRGVIEASASAWQWQGVLREFELARDQLGEWRLREPARFLLSQAQTSLSPLCLAQNTAYLCAELAWREQQPKASLNGRHIPVGLLNPWLPANLRAEGLLNLNANLSGPDKQHMTGQLEVTNASDTLQIDFVELEEQLTLGAGRVQASLDEKGLRASLRLPFVPDGGLDAQLDLPGWSVEQALLRTQPVQAQVSLHRLPADVVTRFIPDTARAQGYLEAGVEMNGTLGEPRLTGKANWREGQMVIPDLGISVEDIDAEIASVKSNTLKFVVSARSGEGTVELRGQTRLEPAQGWPTEATLTSNRLEVLNTVEAYVLIDSQIDVAMQGNTIEIDGEVTVPRARLRPRALPEGTAALSGDVVIVSAEEQTVAQTPWLITSRIRVQLGELVDFDGFGVSGKLKGNLLVIDEPGRPPVGQGELRIEEGIYRLRGQDLTIRRGRLIFANSFIDNPGVDVEATRSVEPVLVGVRLTGTLREPSLTIFSEPAMAETDALSYLLLGHAYAQGTTAEGESVRNTATAFGLFAGDLLARDIGGQLGLDELRVDVGETAQQTSLVVGKYLSSKLYVRYFTGIVESSNIVQLRYQLSPRVQIQTEGGYRGSQSVTGGDIFFTIEY